MAKRRYELGSVERFEADAVGEPGQRRFRLLIQRGPTAACLWLEKEQLQALAMAIDQLLSGSPLSVVWPSPAPRAWQPIPEFPQADIELNIGRLALGYEEGSDSYMLLAHDVEADQDGPATLSCLATRDQLKGLSAQIASVTASGRPRCPLCGAAITDPHHSCQGQNGHV